MDGFEYFFEKAWSDGLPVVPPTEERLAVMLTGTSRDPEELIGLVPPMMSSATVGAIALHAVMAGCKPAYLEAKGARHEFSEFSRSHGLCQR